MNFRLVCHECASRLRTEIKSIGFLEHPDTRCARCGVYIRSGTKDLGPVVRWFPVTDEQLAELRAQETGEPDDRLHIGFGLDEGEEDLGAAQDEICKARIVRCKIYECEPEQTGGAHVVQVYMNDHTPRPVFAGTAWRHDRFPSNLDVAIALMRWRGPSAPEFIIERHEGKGDE
jgi:transcription initiation factor TFIIIB Brf1 subunit/transcription initiation factor TFIIB